MRKALLLVALLVAATLFSGCIQKKEIVFTCQDGTKVAKQELCEKSFAAIEPAANGSLPGEEVFPQEYAASAAECGQAGRQCVFESGFKKFGNDFCALLYSFSSRECDAKNGTLECEETLFSLDAECTAQLAKSAGDSSLCELLSKHFEGPDVDAAVSGCKQAVATKSAYSTAADCEKAPQEKRDACYAIVAASSGDAALCEKTTKKDSCYTVFAAASLEAGYCGKIVSPETNAACLAVVAKKTKDAGLCGGIDVSTGLYGECLVGVAVAAKNESLCPPVSYCKAAVKKDYDACATEECVFEVATRNNDAATCATLSDDAVYGRNRCVTLVASSLKDESLCLQAGAGRELCETRVRALKELPIEG